MECYLNLQVKSKRTLTQVFPLNFVNFFVKLFYKAIPDHYLESQLTTLQYLEKLLPDSKAVTPS